EKNETLQKVGIKEIKANLIQLERQKKIFYQDGYYCLSDRVQNIALRKERIVASQEKLQFAKKIVWLLSKIPTVELIGVSGSVGVGNADRNADIDLFIITSENFLWTTRLLCVLL